MQALRALSGKYVRNSELSVKLNILVEGIEGHGGMILRGVESGMVLHCQNILNRFLVYSVLDFIVLSFKNLKIPLSSNEIPPLH
jgi:hypothetical protein